MSPRSRSISVVIPVYNSEALLRPLVARLAPVLDGLAPRHELILVNDCSRDGSWSVIEELARELPWIRGVQFMRNYGQHNAVLCGIREAQHELVVTMDDDLQHPPEELPRLVEALGDDADVVYGTPESEQHGLMRDLASQITKFALQKAMSAETARSVSALRVFRTQLRDGFADYRGQFVSIDVLLTWSTTRFKAIQVRHDPRSIGVSNYTVRKLITHAMNMMTGFSTFPLQIASVIGFAFTAFGIGVLLFVLIRYMMVGSPVQGFPFLASIIAIFSGAQLFALGIIGEYLARMHFRMMDRPTYAVRTTTKASS